MFWRPINRGPARHHRKSPLERALATSRAEAAAPIPPWAGAARHPGVPARSTQGADEGLEHRQPIVALAHPVRSRAGLTRSAVGFGGPGPVPEPRRTVAILGGP